MSRWVVVPREPGKWEAVDVDRSAESRMWAERFPPLDPQATALMAWAAEERRLALLVQRAEEQAERYRSTLAEFRKVRP